jgi:hypothetical protein
MGDVLPCMMRGARTMSPPKAGADRLVTEADAEQRDAAGEALDRRHRDARLARRARSRRDDDAVHAERLDLVECDRVVAPHVDLGAQLAQVLTRL